MRKIFLNLSMVVAAVMAVVGIITTSSSCINLTSLAIDTGNFLW